MPAHNITVERIRKILYMPTVAKFETPDIQQWIDDAYELAMVWDSTLSGNYLDQVVENLAVWKGKLGMPLEYPIADGEYKAAKDVLTSFHNSVKTSDLLPDDVDGTVYNRTVGRLPTRLFRDSVESTRIDGDRDPQW